MSQVSPFDLADNEAVAGEQKQKQEGHILEEEEKGGTGQATQEPLSVCESTLAYSSSAEVEDEDEADYFADVGFMFGSDNQRPTKRETLEWDLPGGNSVIVALHTAADKDEMSGHSLWPGGRMLAEYLVNHYYCQPFINNDIRCVVELGAGCALASLVALQLWKDTLQCVVVTDQDTGVLVRACDNLETTIQHIVDSVEDKSDDAELNMAINGIASIPVQFESLKWGDSDAIRHVLNTIEEHTEPATLTEYEDSLPPSMSSAASLSHSLTGTSGVDLVLGSDLILDDSSLVETLLRTAAELMSLTGRFLLAQSIAMKSVIEEEMDRVCRELSLQRTVLFESDAGVIMQFVAMSGSDEVLEHC
jgi:predicted nicotinamide N-methyase